MFFKEVSNWNKKQKFPKLNELRHFVIPDNINSLALDLNSLTDVAWTFLGNNQTAFQMRHNEW